MNQFSDHWRMIRVNKYAGIEHADIKHRTPVKETSCHAILSSDSLESTFSQSGDVSSSTGLVRIDDATVPKLITSIVWLVGTLTFRLLPAFVKST